MTVRPIDSIPDAIALAFLPENLAREHQWLAYYGNLRDKKLHIACARMPGQLLQRRALTFFNPCVQFIDTQSLSTEWSIHWEPLSDSAALNRAINSAYACSYELDVIGQDCAKIENGNPIQPDEDQWPIARWLDALLNDAVHRRVSDIHILPEDSAICVRYRIDGCMHSRCELPICVWRILLARIKVLSALDVTENRRPQEGAFERCIHGQSQPVRSAFMPHGSSTKITLRLLRSALSLPTLSELFVIPRQCHLVRQVLERRKGLIVVAGATGSGKTTTLYGCLMYWVTQQLNLITLEDPIEIKLSGVCQSEINTAVNYTFVDGLKAALRHDPDGLLVGEIRDPETCSMALRSAITGHPVLASVHANDSVGVFQRLMGLGASIEELQETIQLVVVQRLARMSCGCGNRALCSVCFGTGYKGCVATAELFKPNQDFFEKKADWTQTRDTLRLEYHCSLEHLRQESFIDDVEFKRMMYITGGTDAKVSSQSG